MLHISAHILSYLSTNLTLLRLTLAQHHQLTPHQLSALALLAMRGPTQLKELRELLTVPKSSLTFAMDALAQRGLIRRKQLAHDRRGWVVVLTAEGVKLSERIIQEEASGAEALLQRLSAEERTAMLRALGQLPEPVVKTSRERSYSGSSAAARGKSVRLT